MLEEHGLKSYTGQTVEDSSSKSIGMYAPSGFSISLVRHIKDHGIAVMASEPDKSVLDIDLDSISTVGDDDELKELLEAAAYCMLPLPGALASRYQQTPACHS